MIHPLWRKAMRNHVLETTFNPAYRSHRPTPPPRWPALLFDGVVFVIAVAAILFIFLRTEP